MREPNKSEMGYVPAGGKGHWMTKVEKYGWAIPEATGELMWIPKADLKVDRSYQRDLLDDKVLRIASKWSWIACGVLTVARRGDQFFVVDGQHRTAAASRRADIDRMPCIVFDTTGIKQEAKGFKGANTERRMPLAVEKFKADLVAEDSTAVYVEATLHRFGVAITKAATRPMSFASVAWAVRTAGADREVFEAVLACAVDLCGSGQGWPLSDLILDSLKHIHLAYVPVTDARFRARAKQVGYEGLVAAAKRSAAAVSKGGAKVWAHGMLAVINKGLRNKFVNGDSILG